MNMRREIRKLMGKFKSRLALVLVISMLLGLGLPIPTAFAAAPAVFLELDEAALAIGGTNPIYTANIAKLIIGDDPVEIALRTAAVGSGRRYASDGYAEEKLEVVDPVNVPDGLEVVIDKGIIKVSATELVANAVFAVELSDVLGTDAKSKVTFTVVKSVGRINADDVTIDLSSTTRKFLSTQHWPKSVGLTPDAALVSGSAITFEWDPNLKMMEVRATTPATIVPGVYPATMEGTSEFVDGNGSNPVDADTELGSFNVIVINSKDGKAQNFVGPKSIDLKRDAAADAWKFDVSLTSGTGAAVDFDTVAADGLTPAEVEVVFAPDAGAPKQNLWYYGTDDEIQGTLVANNLIPQVLTGDIVASSDNKKVTVTLKPNALMVGAKGTITVRQTAGAAATGDNTVALKIPIEVKPLELDASSVANITYDAKIKRNASNNGNELVNKDQPKQLNPTVGSKAVAAVTLMGYTAPVTPATYTATANGSKVDFVFGTGVDPATELPLAKGETKFKIFGQMSGTPGLYTNASEVKVIIADTTTAPVFEDLVMDIDVGAAGSGVTGTKAITPKNSWYADGPKAITAATTTFYFDADAKKPMGAFVPSKLTTLGFTAPNVLVTVADAKRAKGTEVVYAVAKVDGVESKPFKVTINLVDTRNISPTDITFTPDPIKVKVGESTTFNTAVKLVQGADAVPTIEIVDEDKAPSGMATYAIENPGYRLTAVASGKGFVKLSYQTADPVVKMEKFIPLTVEGLEVTPSPKKMDFDLIDKDAGTPANAISTLTGVKSVQTITFTPPAGYQFDLANTPIATALVSDKAGKAAARLTSAAISTIGSEDLVIGYLTTDATASKYTYKIYARGRTHKVGNFEFTAKLVKGTLTNIAAQKVVVPYTIADTTGFVLRPSTDIKIGTKVDSVKSATFAVSHAPAGAQAVWTVTSADAAIATATKSGSNVTVTAVATGATSVVVSGTIDGVAVPNVSVRVLVDGEEVPEDLVVTPASVALDLESVKEATIAVTSATKATVTDITAVSAAACVTAAVDGTNVKVAAVEVGTSVITITGKIDGKDYTKTVTVKVTAKPVDPSDPDPESRANKIYIGSQLINPEGVTNLKLENTLLMGGMQVVVYDSEGVAIPGIKIARTTGRAYAVKGDRLVKISKPKLGRSDVKITYPASTDLPAQTLKLKTSLQGNKPNDAIPVREDANVTVGDRVYLFDDVTTNPANAFYFNPAFFTFKASPASKASVNAQGLVLFTADGEVTVTATAKRTFKGSKVGSKLKMKYNVTGEYKDTTFRAAALTALDDSFAAVAPVLAKAAFPGGATPEVTKLTDKASLTALVSSLQSAKATDIFMLYIDSMTYSKVTGLDMDMEDLAIELAKIPGKIVIVFNGTGSNFFTDKAAAGNADIIAAVAKVEAAYQAKAGLGALTGFGEFGKAAKFSVLSANTKRTDNKPDIGKFEEEFVKMLTITDGKLGNGETKITLDELGSKIAANYKASVIRVYPAKSKLNVFMNEPAVPVTSEDPADTTTPPTT